MLIFSKILYAHLHAHLGVCVMFGTLTIFDSYLATKWTWNSSLNVWAVGCTYCC